MKVLLNSMAKKLAKIIARSRSNKLAKELLLLTDKQLKGLGLSRDLIAKGDFAFPSVTDYTKAQVADIKTTTTSTESQILVSANDDSILDVA